MKDKLLALAAVRYNNIVVEGTELRIRELSTLEFARYGELANDKLDGKGAVVKKANRAEAISFLVMSAVVDADGNPVFNEEEAKTLANSARIGLKIVMKVMELSGSQEDDEKHSNAG
jgi:hypothetical protein